MPREDRETRENSMSLVVPFFWRLPPRSGKEMILRFWNQPWAGNVLGLLVSTMAPGICSSMNCTSSSDKRKRTAAAALPAQQPRLHRKSVWDCVIIMCEKSQNPKERNVKCYDCYEMFIFLWGLLTLPVCFTVGGPKFGSHLVMGQLQMCSDKPKSRPHAENCQPTRQGFDRFILPHGTPCAAAHGTKSRCQTQFQHLNRGNVPGSAYDCFKPVWSQIRQRIWPGYQKVYPLLQSAMSNNWKIQPGREPHLAWGSTPPSTIPGLQGFLVQE